MHFKCEQQQQQQQKVEIYLPYIKRRLPNVKYVQNR